MTLDEIRAFVERTTRSSGVPLRLDDPSVAADIGALLTVEEAATNAA